MIGLRNRKSNAVTDDGSPERPGREWPDLVTLRQSGSEAKTNRQQHCQG